MGELAPSFSQHASGEAEDKRHVSGEAVAAPGELCCPYIMGGNTSSPPTPPPPLLPPHDPGRIEVDPWIADVAVVPPATQQLQQQQQQPGAAVPDTDPSPSPRPTRLRPLIYIYNLPPIWNSRMLQYR